MTSWKLAGKIISDRFFCIKLIVAVLIVVGLLVFRLLAPGQSGVWLMRYCGYWLTAALVVWLVYLIWRFCFDQGKWCALWRAPHRMSWVIALLGAVLWQMHEPHQLRVLFDEHAYVAISKAMHLTREAAYAVRAHYFYGDYYELAYGVDKRAVLFPFLISLVHDVSGFRVENVFWVNGLLGFLSLVLIYRLLLKVSAPQLAKCGQILWVGLPLLPQVATGGGYDLLNVCLIQAWLLMAFIYYEGSDSPSAMVLFIGLTVALTQVRNESVFFAFGALLVVWMKWRSDGKASLAWSSVLLLVFLIPPVAANLIFSKLDYMRETEPGQAFFSMEYMPENLMHAVAFVFNPDSTGMNFPLLGVLGCFSLALFLVNYIRNGLRDASDAQASDPVLFVFVGMVACVFIVYMSSFWGSWEDYLVSRFSLPIWLLLLVLAARVANGFAGTRNLPNAIVWACAIWCFVFSVPASSRAAATKGLIPSKEAIQLEKSLTEVNPMDTLLIAQSPIMPIVHNYASCSIGAANQEPWKVQAALSLGLYKEVLVAEQYGFNFKKQEWVRNVKYELSDEFEKVPVGVYVTGSGSQLRVSRVVGVKNTEAAMEKINEVLNPRAETRFEYFKQVIRILP